MVKKAATLFVMMMLCLTAFASKDVHITFEQLPQKAQQFIKTYYPNCKIAIAKMEKDLLYKSYDVIFTNGDKLEFGSNGEWTKLKCRGAGIPYSIVPQKILDFVKNRFNGDTIIEIERKSSYYDIELASKVEIKFDRKFNVIEIDK